jgi:putative lipoic acid-binding regulatory protein
MINVTTWPVVIIATPRSGSTELAFQIWKKYNLIRYPNEFKYICTGDNFDNLPESIHCFIEPDKHKSDLEKLVKMHESGNKNYIVKLIINNLADHKIFSDILNEKCYKIKLDRENLEDQALSLYTAKVTGKWNQHTPSVDNFEVPISLSEIHNSIRDVKMHRAQLRSLNIDFDVSLMYEKLNFSNSVDCFKNIPPTNADKIRTLIEKFI